MKKWIIIIVVLVLLAIVVYAYMSGMLDTLTVPGV